MSSQEKSNIVSIFGTLFVSLPYILYVFINYDTNLMTEDAFKYWANSLLLLIPIMIITEILLYIIFTIIRSIYLQKEEAETTDERDKLIELKSVRNSHYVLMIGFITALASLSLGAAPILMLQILIISSVIIEIVQNLSQIFYYRNGV